MVERQKQKQTVAMSLEHDHCLFYYFANMDTTKIPLKKYIVVFKFAPFGAGEGT